MNPPSISTVADRIQSLLRRLKIKRAHFSARLPADWAEYVSVYSECVSSMTLLGPMAIAREAAASLERRLQVITGDTGPIATRIRDAAKHLPMARLSILPRCNPLGWADLAVSHGTEIATEICAFIDSQEKLSSYGKPKDLPEAGVLDGISYRIRGRGQPLVLLPLFLSPSQWEPLIDSLANRFTTVTLGGPILGAVAVLESRGQSRGYGRILATLHEELDIKSGELILEVGCGTGVIDRWLAKHSDFSNRIVGVDINPYLLNEGRALAESEGLKDRIELREGNAEALPFSDESFDIAISVTAIEEVNADQLIREMLRVTKPGGRVGIISRAIDQGFFRNVELPPDLKGKVNSPSGNVGPEGCADASLYRRMVQAGLVNLQMFPVYATFTEGDGPTIQFMEDGFLGNLSNEEVNAWRAARAKAEASGTFFMAWPHHCAVGIKQQTTHAGARNGP